MIIDLDAVAAAAPPSGRPARRPGRPVLALVVLLGLLLGGAQPQPRVRDLPMVAVTTSAAGEWLLTGTALYSVHTRSDSGTDLEARSLATGEVLWRRDIEWRPGIMGLIETGPLLLVTDRSGRGTRIVDGRTGRDAVEPGTFSVALPAGDRIVLYDDSGRLTLFDPAAGRIAWQRPFGSRLHTAAATGAHLFTVDDTGTAATFALRDGAPVATSGRPVPAGVAPDVRVLEPRIYLLDEQSVTSVVATDPAMMWTTMLPLPRVAVRCGTRICVSGAAGISAIDPQTGRVVWNNLEWTGGENGLVRVADGHGVLIDPESGAVRRDLGPGLPVGDLLLRAGPARQGRADGLRVIEWATGRIRGRLPLTTASGCRRTANHLACRQANGPVKVWRLL